ncbi:MAG: DUF5684 domain-containing protein [Nannocystales bacterium]
MGDLIAALVQLAIVIVVVAGFWKVFAKAGQPGWACLVPFYNVYVMLQIANKPTWWLVLFFIPVANFIAAILVNIAIAEKFGKSTGFGVGMAFLSFIFVPILGFGDAQYNQHA